MMSTDGESENHPLVSSRFTFARQLAASHPSHSLFIPAYSEAVIESGLWCTVCGSCAPSGKTVLPRERHAWFSGFLGSRDVFIFVCAYASHSELEKSEIRHCPCISLQR